MYDHGWGDGWGWGLMALMPLAWLVLLGLVVWATVVLTRTLSGDERAENPLDILERRYAAGDVDTETYVRIREHLTGQDERSS